MIEQRDSQVRGGEEARQPRQQIEEEGKVPVLNEAEWEELDITGDTSELADGSVR